MTKAVTALVVSVALVAGALTFFLVDRENFAEDLRTAAVEGCERQNVDREGLRHLLRNDNRQSREIDYEVFFPKAPPETLRMLLHRQRLQNLSLIEELRPAECAALYPD